MVVALLLPVPLFPLAAVREVHVLRLERDERVRRREVRDDRLGVLLRILDDIGHQGALPTVVDGLVAIATRTRAHKRPRGCLTRRLDVVQAIGLVALSTAMHTRCLNVMVSDDLSG
jgi:hypothetical protein